MLHSVLRALKKKATKRAPSDDVPPPKTRHHLQAASGTPSRLPLPRKDKERFGDDTPSRIPEITVSSSVTGEQPLRGSVVPPSHSQSVYTSKEPSPAELPLPDPKAKSSTRKRGQVLSNITSASGSRSGSSTKLKDCREVLRDRRKPPTPAPLDDVPPPVPPMTQYLQVASGTPSRLPQPPPSARSTSRKDKRRFGDVTAGRAPEITASSTVTGEQPPRGSVVTPSHSQSVYTSKEPSPADLELSLPDPKAKSSTRKRGQVLSNTTSASGSRSDNSTTLKEHHKVLRDPRKPPTPAPLDDVPPPVPPKTRNLQAASGTPSRLPQPPPSAHSTSRKDKGRFGYVTAGRAPEIIASSTVTGEQPPRGSVVTPSHSQSVYTSKEPFPADHELSLPDPKPKSSTRKPGQVLSNTTSASGSRSDSSTKLKDRHEVLCDPRKPPTPAPLDDVPPLVPPMAQHLQVASETPSRLPQPPPSARSTSRKDKGRFGYVTAGRAPEITASSTVTGEQPPRGSVVTPSHSQSVYTSKEPSPAELPLPDPKAKSSTRTTGQVISNTTSASGSRSDNSTALKEHHKVLRDPRKPPTPAPLDDVPPPVPPKTRNLQAASGTPYRLPQPPPSAHSTSCKDKGRFGYVTAGRAPEITASSTVTGEQPPGGSVVTPTHSQSVYTSKEPSPADHELSLPDPKAKSSARKPGQVLSNTTSASGSRSDSSTKLKDRHEVLRDPRKPPTPAPLGNVPPLVPPMAQHLQVASETPSRLPQPPPSARSTSRKDKGRFGYVTAGRAPEITASLTVTGEQSPRGSVVTPSHSQSVYTSKEPSPAELSLPDPKPKSSTRTTGQVISNTTSASGSRSGSSTKIKDRRKVLRDPRKPPTPAPLDDVPPLVPPMTQHFQVASGTPSCLPAPPPVTCFISPRDEGGISGVTPGSFTVAGGQCTPLLDHRNTPVLFPLNELWRQHQEALMERQRLLEQNRNLSRIFTEQSKHTNITAAVFTEPLLPWQKCIIPGCPNRRYTEGSVVHHFCSKSHADEGRRRGICGPYPTEERCIIPDCPNRRCTEGSVVYQYCSRFHADEGRRRGIYEQNRNLSQIFTEQSKQTNITAAVLRTEPLLPWQKCIIPECPNRRCTEGSVVHHFCSKSHADEGRRRGIYGPPEEKCIIPECPDRRCTEGSVVHQYCTRFHADEGRRRGIYAAAVFTEPLLPWQKCIIPECPNRRCTEGSVVYQYCTRFHADEGRRRGICGPPEEKCIIPECPDRRYTEGSVVHQYCTRFHADEGRRRGIYEPLPPEEKCIIPECTNRRYTEGSVVHQYCSKSHAEEGKRRGIYPCTQDPKDQCDLPNCTRPKAVESNGYKYNYCCRDHALKDDQNILKSKTEVDAFLKQFSVLKVVRLEENQSTKCGGQLFQRFQSVWRGLNSNQRKTILAFHGTPEKNIQSICTNGFDASRRSKQQHGPGEYFATTPDTPMSYCQGGKKMLLCELLLGDVNTHHTIHGDIVVMKDPAHDLPRFVVEFS